jgi:hypothetical protein
METVTAIVASYEVASIDEVSAFCLANGGDCGDGVILGLLSRRRATLGKIVVHGKVVGLFHVEDCIDHQVLELVFVDRRYRCLGLLRGLVSMLWATMELPIVADPYDEPALAALMSVGFVWRDRPWYLEDGVPDRLVFHGL